MKCFWVFNTPAELKSIVLVFTCLTFLSSQGEKFVQLYRGSYGIQYLHNESKENKCRVHRTPDETPTLSSDGGLLILVYTDEIHR